MESTNQINVDLDGQVLAFGQNESFATISEKIKKDLAPARVLTEVLIDDRYIDLDEEENIGQKQIHELGKLGFRSKEVGSLLMESMKLAPKICEALQLECTDIDSFFEKGELQAAHERIGEMSALVDWLLQLISGLQSYGSADFRVLDTGHGNVFDSVKRMETLLSQLHLKLQVQEFDAFREILTGDFKEELGHWGKLFTEASTNWTPRSLQRES